MIARRTRLYPAGTGQITGDDTAYCPLPRRAAKQRAIIRRLERQHLAVLVELHPDLFHRRAGPRAHHQLIRLI